MELKVFLDVNIILDYILKRPEGYESSKKILEKIIAKEIEGYTSSVAIHIVGHILKKHIKIILAKKIILALLNDIQIINPPREILVQAMSSKWSDLEDAIQYYTALHHKIDVLISRDRDFIKKTTPSLPILMPKQLLENL